MRRSSRSATARASPRITQSGWNGAALRSFLLEFGKKMAVPQRRFERGAEEAEVADARDADVLRRDALHLARRAAVEAVDGLGVARRHHLVVGERERHDGGAH